MKTNEMTKKMCECGCYLFVVSESVNDDAWVTADGEVVKELGRESLSAEYACLKCGMEYFDLEELSSLPEVPTTSLERVVAVGCANGVEVIAPCTVNLDSLEVYEFDLSALPQEIGAVKFNFIKMKDELVPIYELVDDYANYIQTEAYWFLPIKEEK